MVNTQSMPASQVLDRSPSFKYSVFASVGSPSMARMPSQKDLSFTTTFVEARKATPTPPPLSIEENQLQDNTPAPIASLTLPQNILDSNYTVASPDLRSPSVSDLSHAQYFAASCAPSPVMPSQHDLNRYAMFARPLQL